MTAVFFFYILKIFAISLEHISNATFINNTFILYRLPDDCKCTCSNVDTNAEFASKQLNLTRGTKKGDKSSTESTTSEECGQFSMDGHNSINSINVSEARVHWPCTLSASQDDWYRSRRHLLRAPGFMASGNPGFGVWSTIGR
ncbi:hypothetical protein DdX_20538 [Ditylenchus destructor]|uniref:Uncharacterized protein n=1 Tax=Ditylenchus destructor TaxID=166010 RepID=A0AAD4MH18_9BILA|nr:hypothetical protein DdX_20538 [Ditylenchus destructor]